HRRARRSARRCRRSCRSDRRRWSAASGLPHEDQPAAGAGQRALHEQEVAVGIGANDADLLDRHALVAHVAGHLEAAIDAARGGARPDRAWLAMMVRPVGLRSTLEVVALDVAREALALRDAGDVDEVAGGEHVVDGHRLADLELIDAVEAELAERAE